MFQLEMDIGQRFSPKKNCRHYKQKRAILPPPRVASFQQYLGPLPKGDWNDPIRI